MIKRFRERLLVDVLGPSTALLGKLKVAALVHDPTAAGDLYSGQIHGRRWCKSFSTGGGGGGGGRGGGGCEDGHGDGVFISKRGRGRVAVGASLGTTDGGERRHGYVRRVGVYSTW